MKIAIKSTVIIQLLIGIFSLYGCKSLLPESIDALGSDVNYTTKEFMPTLGQKFVYENSATYGSSSSLPLSFKLVNVRRVDGTPATELTDKFPVKVWKRQYTGEERSIQEIEDKREIEYRSILDIGNKSGNIIIWDFGNSNWIRTQPDSCYLFDVEISNSGGRKYARNLRLKPYKERPYYPSQYNFQTGLAIRSRLDASLIMNLEGENTGDFIFFDEVEVYVFKDVTEKSVTPTLKISVVDSLNNEINIQQFKDTDWKGMIHGFKHRFEGNKAVYDVAYPMPLINLPTKYTSSNGDHARIRLQFNRIGFGGFLNTCLLGFDFAIYEEGHWEIQFRFRGESPKFIND